MTFKDTILHRGRVRVCKSAIQGISYEEPFDYEEKFGITGQAPAPGTVYLHLIGGGRINISAPDPEAEAQEWAVMAGLL